MTDPERAPAGEGRGSTFATISLGLAWTYLATVLLLDETLFGVAIGVVLFLALLIVGWIAIAFVLRVIARRGSVGATRIREVGVLSLATLIPLFFIDLGYSVYANARESETGLDLSSDRFTDARVWHGELYPLTYYPTGSNYTRFKPGVTLSAVTYGEFYDSRMIDSPLLRDSVLELRHVDYVIDELGFRGTTSVDSAELLVLGDSFAFGFATSEAKTWTSRLSEQIGSPIYNLGVSASGPRAQTMLLADVLSERSAAHPARLIWMIFEGNDLENSYDTARPTNLGATETSRSPLRGTVLALLWGMPRALKEQSLIDRWRSGGLGFGGGLEEDRGLRVVDGIQLVYPLYRSERFGYRMFNPLDIDRAGKPQSYVLKHPNRPELDGVFADMRTLAERRGFEVTVVVAPSAARVHGPHFEGFPHVTETPHLIDYVVALAERTGFDVLDLLPAFRERADRELLYYRDDHHWNERGNELAAQLIGDHLAGNR